MELTPEQQQALEQQKAQCPFCKIIKGEIASKKVYEDDQVIAVLDINPATKGHVLLMPKEHYPILPLLPAETFKALFAKTHAVAQAAQKGVIATGMNVFIANGAAAGQQSQHFMLHIIPRESGDSLDQFAIPHKTLSEADRNKPLDMLKNNLGIMMSNHFKRNPTAWHDSAKDKMGQLPQTFTLDQVLMIIEKNPQIKAAIEQDPDGFEELIQQQEQLRMVFKDVSYDEVLAKLGVQRKGKKETDHEVADAEKTKGAGETKQEKQTNQQAKDEDDVDLDEIGDLL